jgi:hypothetical protein
MRISSHHRDFRSTGTTGTGRGRRVNIIDNKNPAKAGFLFMQVVLLCLEILAFLAPGCRDSKKAKPQ